MLDKDPDLKLFLQATRRIWSDNVETFVRISQETYESSISDREQLKTWIVASDYESLRKRLSGAKDEAEKELIIDLVAKSLKDNSSFQRIESTINVLFIITKIYDTIPERKRNEIADQFANVVSRAPYLEDIRRFPSDELLPILKDCSTIFRRELLSKIISTLEIEGTEGKPDKTLDLELLDSLIKHHSVIEVENGLRLGQLSTLSSTHTRSRSLIDSNR